MNGKTSLTLLDTQSDTVFDEGVNNALQAEKMSRDTTMKSERVCGLRMRGYISIIHIDLPPVYPKDCIPVNRDHIPIRETANQWNNLPMISGEISPLQDCEIGLLITPAETICTAKLT